MRTIYLDHNATTPLDREVISAMQPALSGIFGNPSSDHRFGYDARKAVEKAREQVAGLIGCSPDEIVFTSGGTESNNHAIKGIARAHGNRGRHIITSSIEHPATLEACRYLETEGFEISYIAVDARGLISTDELQESIREDTILITVMHANNEIGSIQPIEQISRIARKHDILLHTDAAQSAGKIPVHAGDLGVDLLSLAGHKMYGPKGMGALYIRRGVTIEKLIHGGDHEMNRRAGTENVLLIAGFGKACEVARRHLEKNRKIMQDTRDSLYSLIAEEIPEAVWNGDPGNCLPNTLSISFPGTDASLLLSGMPGIAASAGAACHAEKAEISHVLRAIDLAPELAQGTIRLSTGKLTTMADVKEAARQIVKTARSLMPDKKPEKSPAADRQVPRLTSFTHGLGCACKMRPQDLEEVLKEIPVPEHASILVDTRDSDDATVWKLDDETAWVQSVDFFTPIVDDPFSFGAIAAANALSDLYAMGATPLFGLNIVAFPVKRLPLSVIHTILEGGRSVAGLACIHIVGGHTIEDNELKYGMVVNGLIHPDRILRNSGAKPGDALILTKAIGTGILATALKRGSLNKKWLDQMVESMSSLNRIPAEIFPRYDVHAVTDVTGFGLLGHLLELARASQVSARINFGSVPLLEGAKDSARNGMIPGGSLQNLEFVSNHVDWKTELSREQKFLLADAQTSGGLLVSLPETEAGKYLSEVRQAGCPRAEIIGEIIEKEGNPLHVH